MNFTDWARAIFNPYPAPSARAVPTETEKKPLPSGRVSTDVANQLKSKSWVFQSPKDYETQWRLESLDVEHLDRYSPKELLDMLIDISPEISRAVWDFQRLCNPGWELKCYVLGSDKVEQTVAKAHLDSVIDNLKAMYGSFDVVIGRFFIGAYLRGAFSSELVLDESATETIDFVAPDPYSVRFRMKEDPVRKFIWEPGQWQGGDFQSLDIPTFKYIPIDPMPGSPYGRSLAAPSLFTAIFSLGLLHDVKRVVMQQGYKRMDISLDVDLASDAFGEDNQGYASLGEYIKAAVAAIMETYRRLEPEDAFVHTNVFTINSPAGTIDSDSIGAINMIMKHLESSITRALKSNSLMMDVPTTTNEADSNRRWEIHAASIKSLQHYCEAMIESQFGNSLRAKGIQANVQFRFSELRAAEMMRDEQTRALAIQNSRNEYEAGFESQDAASNKAVNHDADAPEPRKPLTQLEFTQDNGDGNEDVDKADRYVWKVSDARRHS